MNKLKNKVALIVIASLLLTFLMPALEARADDHFLHNETVTLSNGNTYTVRALDEGYDNNLYLSLRDVSTVLSGTDSAFSVDINDSGISVFTGQDGDAERSLSGWSEEERGAYYGKSLAMNDFSVNDSPKKYYTIRASYQGGTDCFISMLSLAMILDTNMYVTGDNELTIEPEKKLVISPLELEENGYFLELDSCIVGDATTGQIFYGYDAGKPYPIASTTKLMTCLLTEEAIVNGSLTMDTMLPFSAEGERISHSADGSVQMSVGKEAPVSELILGALLPSSNECALTLGEAIGGSEENFVRMMNEKAAEIGMTTAMFYNTNGLPSYGVGGVPGKRQNTMSAEDMFRMCSYLLETYPSIKELSALTDASLPHLGRDVKNTNALLYNMPEINGLKTGTTDKAGACLITSLTVNDGMMDHDLVVVVLGAEGSKARFTISELLARYAQKVVIGELSADGVQLSASSNKAEDADGTVKSAITARALVKMVVNGAFKQKKEVQ